MSLAFLLYSTNVLASFLPNNEESLSFSEEKSPITEGALSFNDSGYLAKPAMQGNAGERTDIKDVLRYTVKSGDTLSEIASRFNISVETIMVANNISSNNSLSTGKTLNILPVDGLLYTVGKDDTLESIAKKYNIDKTKILSQNNLKESDKLVIQQSLILPGAVPPAPVIINNTALAQKHTPQRVASISSNVIPRAQHPQDSADYTSDGTFNPVWPVAGGGKVSQGYRGGHLAMDITYGSATMYPNILATESGKVIQAETSGWNGGYGNVIVIDHGNGIKTRYAHNSEVFVSVGEYVKKGQVISKMGKTGRVYGRTGIHLHFEIIKDGKKKNPASYF